MTAPHPLPQKAYTVQPVPPNYLTLSNPSTDDATEEKEKVLWIGCSDSLVSETDSLTNINRSDIFVHRNLGNRVSVGDVSSGSALEWCVEGLKVQHIIVCGHYDCHLLSESKSDSNNWYHSHPSSLPSSFPFFSQYPSTKSNSPPQSDFIQLHQLSDAQEPASQDQKARNRHFEELYVLAEIEWLKKQDQVQRAVKEWGCQVHAFVYDRERGECVRLVEKEG
ncbi:carbonic anhydrase protein [Rutstroemia sp. NJR-2017a BBW]|nr:carbonic anhydrase protein [Rutstroemia sp. NJR-2017a BBW]